MTGKAIKARDPHPDTDHKANLAKPSALHNLTVPAIKGEDARQLLREQTADFIRTMLNQPTAESMAKIAALANAAETETPKEYPAWTPKARGERAGDKAFTKGDAVSVDWTDGWTYNATIIKVNKHTCKVQFEDGTTGTAKIENLHAA